MIKTQIEIHNIHPEIKIHIRGVRTIAQKVLSAEKFYLHHLSLVFVDDEYLRRLHRDFLNEDPYTDVMTFDLSETNTREGEIYISLDRAQYYAKKYRIPLDEELTRLIIHGILHLKGYDDQTEAEHQRMHQKENSLLRQLAPLPELSSHR